MPPSASKKQAVDPRQNARAQEARIRHDWRLMLGARIDERLERIRIPALAHEETSLRLHQAVLSGDAAAVQHWLGVGARADYRVEDMTALAVAANQGHADCVAALLPFSKPNETLADTGHNALSLAIAFANAPCVALLAPVCDMAIRCHGRTALESAVARDDPAMVESLLPHDTPPPAAFGALIDLAYGHDTLDTLSILLREAPPEAFHGVNAHGLTPLMNMAIMQNELLTRALIPLSDPMARGPQGKTALMIAARGEAHMGDYNLGCVAALLPVSDVHARDELGHTALSGARAAGNHPAAALIGEFIALSERAELGESALAAPGPSRKTTSL